MKLVKATKTTDEFNDFVFEGPGISSPTIRGTANIKTGKVVKYKVYNNDQS